MKPNPEWNEGSPQGEPVYLQRWILEARSSKLEAKNQKPVRLNYFCPGVIEFSIVPLPS